MLANSLAHLRVTMTRTRESARLLQQVNLFHLELFTSKLVLVKRQLEEEASRSRRKRKKRLWARSWLLRRPLYGQYEKLMHELTSEDVSGYKNFLRMDPEMFQELLVRVGPKIEKKDSFCRKALEPGLKLAITLRYLATGNSYRSLQYGFRVASNTISLLIPAVCEAITAAYADEVFSCPVTPDNWKSIAELFASRWNFPHCVGALDGKHIAIRCREKGGSLYYNYKGFHRPI